MSAFDPDLQEERLLEERERTLHAVQQAESEESEGQREGSGELSRAPFHMADAGSDTQEEEKDFANVNRESEKIARIDEALRVLRNDRGAYRTCEECGGPIQAERLEIVPWTRRCAACAEEGRQR